VTPGERAEIIPNSSAQQRADERYQNMMARKKSDLKEGSPAGASNDPPKQSEAQRRADERYQNILNKQATQGPTGSGSPTSNAGSSPQPSARPGALGAKKEEPEATTSSGRSSSRAKGEAWQPEGTCASCDPSDDMEAALREYNVSVEEKFGVEVSPSGRGYELDTWDRMHGRPPDEILPNFLWLGAERNALFMDVLKDQSGFSMFTHVVFATNQLKSPYKAHAYFRIMLPDDSSAGVALRACFEEANAFIERAARWRGPKGETAKVLIHCRQGESRSSTLTIAYFMSHYRCSLREACEWVKAHRSCICPNTGFFLQLQKYEKELTKEPYNSVAVEEARSKSWCSVGKYNGV